MSFKHIPVKSIAAVTVLGYLAGKYVSSKLSEKNCAILIESAEDWDANEEKILNTFKKCQVIGIDCEWVTIDDKRNPVSLLQLASASGFCVLVRLSCIPIWLIPQGLIDLLANEKITKVGVGVWEDSNKLLSDYCLEVRSVLDLRFLAKDLDELQGKKLGLQNLAFELLGQDLDKTVKIRCSDWEALQLSPEQIKYAMNDAVIAAKIYFEIEKRYIGWNFFSTKFSNLTECYIDVPFKQSIINKENKPKSGSFTLKQSVKTRYSKSRQRPMYDNCQLIAPDGELLCSCDRGKANWYIQKELGEKVADDPFTVRLVFEPSGRPRLDNVFYTKEKQNQCVVCGKTENFHRKLVIPSEYRRYFPNIMKNNLSHDVLLLCVYCHKKSNIIDQQMREKLANLCDAPLGSGKNVKFKANPIVARVKSAANALMTSGSKIPQWRIDELEALIKTYYDIPSVTNDVLKEACDLDTTLLNEDFTPHGLKVYQHFCRNGGLIKFERMWRQHFLDTMQPKYLPVMWSVEHNHKRLALQVTNHERDIDFDVTVLGISPELMEEFQA